MIQALEAHQMRLDLWSLWLDPTERELLGDHLGYLRTHYHDEQVWERND